MFKTIFLVFLSQVAISRAQELDSRCPTTVPNLKLAHASDCTRFMICSWGRIFEQTCPGGNHFNPVAKECQSPALAGCQNPIVTPPTSPIVPGETTTVSDSNLSVSNS